MIKWPFQKHTKRQAINITQAGTVSRFARNGASAAAVASGKSLQNYILDALNAKMQQEGQPLEIDPAESGEEGGL